MPTIIGLAANAAPPTRIFSSTPIAPAQPVVYSVPLLDMTVRRLRPLAPRRDPRPVTLRLDAEDVNEKTWRQIKLIVWKPDESICEASLLRPLWWIAETGAKVGGMIRLAMTDMGVVGPAKVLAINPCPKIAPAVPGRRSQVVIGKFKHTARFLLRIRFEGLDKPLEVTPNHPVFSLDRGDFVPARSLRVGERCKSKKAAVVTKIEVKYGSVPVYNLEVHRDHTFLVTKLGILVHNSYEITGVQNTSGYVAAPTLSPVENAYGTALNNYASVGALDEIASVKGFDQTIPGGSKPDYLVNWRDGTQTYGDLYQPEGGSYSTIADEIRDKANDQTQGGVVIVGLSGLASDAQIRTATAAARAAVGKAGFSGKGVIIMIGSGVFNKIFKS